MFYEGLKENSTIVIVPSSAIDTMQLGNLAGITALTMDLEKNKASDVKKTRGKISRENPEEEL
ncbi:hypothetical protein Lste_3117 [Legionella steelei]|uniref:Uncharacterized protein n=1 Tax=Legionella steelei TaxID=947033 RepID=A0A0W0ZCX0_9GAMM|nr:hypothetical protein [Legionella steelei]KTD66911.1 hypothetical protein Lste_3117 [Legionella steelei]